MPRGDFSHGAHVVFKLTVHLVFVTKYRRKALSERVYDVMRAAWLQVCTALECDLTESGWEPDHVHLLIAYPPKVELAALVQRLKGLSARRVRRHYFPEVRAVLRGPAFWSPAYCAVSCGGAPLETVKAYVRSQAGPSPAGRAASSPDVATAHVRGIRGTPPVEVKR